MHEIVERPDATIDVDDIADSLVDYGSKPAAYRFRDALKLAYEQLARFPYIGSPKEFPNNRLSGLRSWHIAGFPKHLIFYVPTDKTVEIVRVLYGGRDLTQIFSKPQD